MKRGEREGEGGREREGERGEREREREGEKGREREGEREREVDCVFIFPHFRESALQIV